MPVSPPYSAMLYQFGGSTSSPFPGLSVPNGERWVVLQISLTDLTSDTEDQMKVTVDGNYEICHTYGSATQQNEVPPYFGFQGKWVLEEEHELLPIAMQGEWYCLITGWRLTA